LPVPYDRRTAISTRGLPVPYDPETAISARALPVPYDPETVISTRGLPVLYDRRTAISARALPVPYDLPYYRRTAISTRALPVPYDRPVRPIALSRYPDGVADRNPLDSNRDGDPPDDEATGEATGEAADERPTSDRASVDRALVERALKGDAQAWGAIVERYSGLAFGTARRVGLDREEAEDVVQTVFTSLVRSLGTIRDPGGLASWIATSARRAAWRTARRSRAARGGVELAHETAANESAAADAALERRLLVEQALSAIDERCRALLQALFLGAHEPDYTSLAVRFGMSMNSVGPVRNRCLRRVLEALERLGYQPADTGNSWRNESDRRTKSPRAGS
jgi:RNA polymerase sigma factor (sigma-70 family)